MPATPVRSPPRSTAAPSPLARRVRCGRRRQRLVVLRPRVAAQRRRGSQRRPAQKDDALAAKLVPQDVSADGKIVFGTDASYPPNEFIDTDGTTIIGMDVDLGKAVAQKLGLDGRVPEQPRSTASSPASTRGKYELGMSSFTINAERTQTVDMVSYFTAGTSSRC